MERDEYLPSEVNFEVVFEAEGAFNVSEVRGERVPEARGRVAEGSQPPR